ncbi:MAG: DEAD/DEAH box helicase [Desulfovibrio sp.]|nr:DEAD/DEAH box helicase [Desulfovibrio sp.]
MTRADTKTQSAGEHDVAAFIAAVEKSPRLGPQITGHRILPAQEAAFAENRRPWSAAVRRLLDARGIRLYSHQALATDHVRAGHAVVVATPTASGKTLIYNLPVLERLLQDPDAHALYLFPLKALAQDQLAGFNALTEGWPEEMRPKAALYDGDTTDPERRRLRRNPPQVLITNPEMLHLGMLPYHESWAPFLAGLTHVVVDEAHTYRGVFGSHMAQIFRRLERVAGRYGSRPVWTLCTATVGNPAELAQGLIGDGARPIVIGESGAPQGRRHFLFLNPDLAPSTAAIDLLKEALARGLRTIVYCRSRRMTELISLWAGSEAGPYSKRISAYRAGFLPEERREIEKRMASGELLCVVSTSALELGIDIGGLDVCILVGYPGTIMATLQRGGRVGRARQESAVIVVAGEDALDQYFARNPGDFFSRPPEKAVVNPDNPVILARHLECAAAEMPLSASENWLQAPSVRSVIRDLEAKGLLLRTAGGSEWLAARKRPQRGVDLRGTGQTYTIVNEKGSVIGSVDAFRAWRETHPGATYLHRGRSYVIQAIDAGSARVLAREERVSWFTRTRASKSTVILEETGRRSIGRALVCRGRLRITDCVTGYEKRSVSGNRLLTIVPLDAPPQVFETEGLWYVIPESVRQKMEAEFLHFMGSIHAMEHALIGMLPLQVMADRNDFGGISIPMHPQVGYACVFVYDGLPGGAGLTRQAFDQARDLLDVTRRAVTGCPCEGGCPSCVHSPKCGSGNRPISKEGAVCLLDELLTMPAHACETEGDMLERTLVISPAPDIFDAPSAPVSSSSAFVASAPATAPAFWQPDTRLGLRTGPGGPPLPVLSRTAQPEAFATPAPYTADAPVPLAPPARYVVFDVETRRSAAEVGGWNRADRMGVSVMVAYDSAQDSYRAYREEELDAFFTLAAKADLVVGFNSLRFDYQVLSAFSPYDLATLPSLDILQRVHERLNYRLPLDNLAQATLGAPKTADGLQALAWWREGRIDEIAEYCRRDVELTLGLYRYGLEHGFLLFTNKAGQRVRLPIDFASRTAGKAPADVVAREKRYNKDVS